MSKQLNLIGNDEEQAKKHSTFLVDKRNNDLNKLEPSIARKMVILKVYND